MSIVPRLKASPGVLVRTLVSIGAVLAVVAAVAAYASGQAVLGAGLGSEFVMLVAIGALSRRYGVALPGNGFSSYIVGVTAFAVLDRGWACAALVAPTAMVAGDLLSRRLPARTALGNAAHLTAGTAVVGLMYERLGGLLGADALDATNLGPLVALLTLLPVVVNATFYLELALGRSLAWVDAWLTARWETIVYACSVGLALAWLRLSHAGLGPVETLVVGAALAAATATSVYVIRLGVRADELALIQGLSQVIARDISLAKSFGRIQELTRRLVPWEQMGFARYDAHTNEMELVADTAAGGRSSFRFDANAGLTGEAVRLRRPVVAHALRPDQVVVPGGERPGAEVLVPLYHAGQLVGLWSVRHSDPLMYRETDELAGVIERDEHLRAGALPSGDDDLVGPEGVRHDGTPQPHRLTGQSGVRVEAEAGPAAGGGVGYQLHFVGVSVIPRKPHLLPRHQPAGELLDAPEALRERDVP